VEGSSGRGGQRDPGNGDRAGAAGTGRVLLADDDRLTSDFVASLLRKAGHEVETVYDGEQAIERAARGGVDLVLVDVMMPRINGLEACRIVKSLPGASFLPVVLLTAKTDTASRVEGLRVGADDYICKPIEERELLQRVSAMVRMKRLHDEISAAKARLEELSAHDEMTGLHNFRHLNARLTEEFKRSERYHDPLACLLIDIDGLRQWNDAYGRFLGDAIVRDVASAIRAALREIDIVARYGGDEFLVVLPSTHFAGALSAADRVWRDVRALAWPTPRGEQDLRASASGRSIARVTLSIGVSLFPSRDVRSKDQLLRAAEASLLRSKRDGGDRICVFQHQGYIYSPAQSEKPPPPPTPVPKPPSNSGIVAARRIGEKQPTPAPPAEGDADRTGVVARIDTGRRGGPGRE
jgi:two-component system cell cycle response regulator